MASKYSQKFAVPQGFTEIVHDFTREVLRDQPEDLLEYASQYFEALHEKKPFNYESKVNVKSEDPEKIHYLPKGAAKDFDPNKQSGKTDKSLPSNETTHKEEKIVVAEYVNNLTDNVLIQAQNQDDNDD